MQHIADIAKNAEQRAIYQERDKYKEQLREALNELATWRANFGEYSPDEAYRKWKSRVDSLRKQIIDLEEELVEY